MKKILLLFFSVAVIFSVHAQTTQGKAIVIYNSDKTVSVIYPAPKAQKPKETEKEFLQRVYNRTVTNDSSLRGLPYEIVDVSRLPSREFRDAWEGAPGKAITVNKEKAEKIKRERIKRQILQEQKDQILEEMAVESLKKQGKP